MTRSPGPALVLTCEHASHALPARHRRRFSDRAALLSSHRGWDPGAMKVAKALARAHSAPLVAGEITRLLVDLNRSAHNPSVFGLLSRELPRSERGWLLQRYHAPHWERVRLAISDGLARAPWVLHVAVHSFTPVLDGRSRELDVGLLYDPQRSGELSVAAEWKRRLEASAPGLRVRRNAPYRGRSDGIVTAMRRRWGPRRYVGIELELCQGLLADRARKRALLGAVRESLSSLLAGETG